jgi:hypothetical protein
MTTSELIEQFNIRYEFIASQDAPGYEDSEILLLLNEANANLINELYRAGAERNEEISRKLGKLFVPFEFNTSAIAKTGKYNGQIVVITDSVKYILSESVDLSLNTNVPVRGISHDQYNSNKKNPFKKPYEDLCWRIREESNNILISDDTILKYYNTYIKTESPITLIDTSELHPSAHYDLVDLAVRLAYDRAFRK